jgi:hypothetical protein
MCMTPVAWREVFASESIRISIAFTSAVSECVCGQRRDAKSAASRPEFSRRRATESERLPFSGTWQ